MLPRDRRRLPGDLLAGLTLAAIAVPEVMGYAKIAGMPVITGLYTMLVPAALFALAGSSRHLAPTRRPPRCIDGVIGADGFHETLGETVAAYRASR